MPRVFIALLVGLAIGAAVFFFIRADAPSPSLPSAVASLSEVAARAPLGTSHVFVSTTHPGLVVTVMRSGVAEAQARIEISRSIRAITGDLSWLPAGTETSDVEGRAEFPATSGRYYVSATATDGTHAIEAVDVSWGASPTAITLTLVTPVAFGGQVVDKISRRPIAGARLRADPQPDPKDLSATIAAGNGVTDSLGRFGLQLPSQRWRFEARAPGYLSNELEVEKPSADLVIELTRGVQVSGLVVDSAGTPIADASVRLMPGDVTQLATDREGRFSITAPHSAISIHAAAPDGRQGLNRVTLTEQQETAQVRIVVGAGADLVGVVRDAQGPVAHADVRILAEPESLEVASFDTAPDGRFTAKGLPPGRYSVRAQEGLGRRATAVGIELPGAAPLELVLSGSGRVIGVVQDGEGQPAEGAKVTLSWPKGLNEVRRAARAGADGRFEFDDLLPAEVVVQAQWEDLVSEETGTYVAPGATVELVLVAAPQGRLVGTVTGPPIDRVLVRNDRPGGEFIEVGKNDRRFEKLLAPGTYRIFAEAKKEGEDDLPQHHVGFQFIESITATVRAGEITTVVLDVPAAVAQAGDGGVRAHRSFSMHPELGSGISFENSPGGVRVDFLMSDCPAAKAGVLLGDLVVAIDGETTRDALDAFARVRKPAGGTLDFQVRREGQDLKLTLR